jgi:hypothetical protein
MSIKERMNPYADTRVGNPAIFESHPAAQPAPTVQEPVAIHQFRAPGLADCIEAYTAIKQAQTQTVQEPVAWMHEWDDGERIPMLRKRDVDSSDIDSPKSVRPLVFGDTTPPAAPVPTSSIEMVTANLVREGVNKHKARELAEHFYPLAAAQPAPDTRHMSGWMKYDAATDVLTIHGRRYSAAMFGESGFLAQVGTLLRIEDGQPECVTLTTVQPAVPLTDEQIDTAWLLNGGGLAANRYYDFARAIEAAHGITKGQP